MASIVALLVLFFTSVWRRRFGMSYEAWQLMHSVLAVVVVITGLLHALLVGYYISQPWEKGLWVVMTAGLVWLGIWTRIIQPLHRLRHKWRVLEVVPEPNSSYTVTVAPESSSPRQFSFRPGQFAWLLTANSTPFALTYHPFSISSSAEDTSGSRSRSKKPAISPARSQSSGPATSSTSTVRGASSRWTGMRALDSCSSPEGSE